jgi:hypothetical protein
MGVLTDSAVISKCKEGKWTKGNISLNCSVLNYENKSSNKRIWKIILCYLPLLGNSSSVSNIRVNEIVVKFRQHKLGVPHSMVLKYMNIRSEVPWNCQ